MDRDDGPARVQISELVELATDVLRRVSSEQDATVHLTRDLYWCVPKEEKYHPYEEPSTFTIGQISEDLESLRRTVARDDYVPPNALIWLGRLIEAVGENLIP